MMVLIKRRNELGLTLEELLQNKNSIVDHKVHNLGDKTSRVSGSTRTDKLDRGTSHWLAFEGGIPREGYERRTIYDRLSGKNAKVSLFDELVELSSASPALLWFLL